MNTVEFKSIKRGDIFWESEYGQNVLAVALEDASMSLSGEHIQWSFLAQLTNNKTLHYLSTEGLTHYGPTLWTSPCYSNKTHTKDFINDWNKLKSVNITNVNKLLKKHKLEEFKVTL